MFNGAVKVPLVYEIDGVSAKKEGCVELTFANLKVREYPVGSGSFIYTSCDDMSINFEDREKYQLIDAHDVNGFTVNVYLYAGGKGIAKNKIINAVVKDGEMVMMLGEKGKEFLIGLINSYDDI